MALGSFNREDLQAPMAEINATPLVDVLLVLLVIFLVTAPMLTEAIKLQLPHENASHAEDRKPAVISIDVSGQYFLDGKAINENELDRSLADIAAADASRPVHIRADQAVPYGKVSHLLAAVSHAGLTHMGFVTQPANP